VSFVEVLLSVILIYMGFPFSYGIFQDYYTTHDPFKSKPSGIAAIGTSALVSLSTAITSRLTIPTGNNVPRLNHHLHGPPTLAESPPAQLFRRSRTHSHIPYRQFLGHHGLATDHHARSPLRNRGLAALQSAAPLHGRMVRAAKRNCLWNHVGA
jgi:hypothetical protein